MKFLRNLTKAFIMILFVGGVVFASFLAANKIINVKSPSQSDPEIIIENEIRLVIGEEYQLAPYLKNSDEEIEYGQYSFKTKGREIAVTETGMVTALSKTSTNAIVVIHEINLNIEKEVKIIVKEGIGSVFDITNSTGATVFNNDVLKFAVTMLPEDADLTKYVTFETLDEESNKFDDILTMNVSNNELLFTATGLGKGLLVININSDEDNVHFRKAFNFDITLPNRNLADSILNGKKLLTKSDLSKIESIEYTGESLDVDLCSCLPNLNSIYFGNNENVPELTNIDLSLTYYFHGEVYKKAYFDDRFVGIKDNIEPFDKMGKEERFVVYISDKAEKISLIQITDAFEFKVLNTTGYTNNGQWSETESNQKPIDLNSVIDYKEHSLKLYAIWTPIKYNIEYNSSFGQYHFENGYPFTTVEYDQNHQVLDFNQFKDYESHNKIGYNFLGWTLNSVKNTVIVHSDEDIKEINLILPNSNLINLTEKANDTVTLVDVWKPIEYTLQYSLDAKLNDSLGTDVLLKELEISKQLKETVHFFDDKFNLEEFTIVGYNLLGFRNLKTGKDYKVGENITNAFTNQDNDIVILTPIIEEKSYCVVLNNQADSEIAPNDGTVLPKTITIKYSEVFKVPEMKITAAGIKTYYWYLDQDNNSLQGNTELAYNPNNTLVDLSLRYFNELLNKVDNIDNINEVSAGKIKIYAKTTKVSYNAIFNTSDVKITGNTGEQVNKENQITDSYNISINDVVKTGYTFTSWSIVVNDKSPVNIKDKMITISQSGVFANGKLVVKTDNTTISITFTPLMQANVTIVNFKHDQASTNPFVSINAVYDSKVINVPSDPTKVGYNFIGWALEGTNSEVDFTKVWNIDKPEVTLYGMFEKKTFTFNFTGGTVTNNEKIKSYKFEEKLPTPSPLTGFTFKGWNYNGTILNNVQDFNTTEKVTLHAEWQRNSYPVIFQNFYDYNITFTFTNPDNNVTKTVNVYEDTGKNIYYKLDGVLLLQKDESRYNDHPYDYTLIYIPYGSHVVVQSASPLYEDNKGYGFYNRTRSEIGSYLGQNNFSMPANDINLKADSNEKNNCIFGDSLVYLANGTTKLVKDVKLGDVIKTWDFTIGSFTYKPVMFYEIFDKDFVNQVTLYFEDGTSFKFVQHQSFFSLEDLDYIAINNHNCFDMIGKQLLFDENSNPVFKTIVDVSVKEIYETTYEIFTVQDYNFVCDNIVTVEPVIHCHSFYKINSDLRYDEDLMKADILKYGLYTYDEWKKYGVTEEAFNLADGKSFKVAVGKGFIDYQTVVDMLGKFLLNS